MQTLATFASQSGLKRNRLVLEHLDSLGIDLCGSVYEPGCGVGLFSGFFAEKYGCKVYATDVQHENVQVNLLMHPWRKGYVVQADVQEPGNPFDRRMPFFNVFCYGLLYHLEHPGPALMNMAQYCDAHFFLETCVYHEDNGQANYVQEFPGGVDQGISNVGCVPARNWIMTNLQLHFPHVYVTVKQPNHREFPTRWPASPEYRKRAVFVASRQDLGWLDTLTTILPMEQEAYGSPSG